MRSRVELTVAGGVLLVLIVVVTILGARRARVADTDRRRSTFVSGPSGARAVADALIRLGVPVERYRRRPANLPVPSDDERAVLAILGPSVALDRLEGEYLLAYVEEGGDLLLAGPSADAAIACFGYRVVALGLDSVPALVPGGAVESGTPWVYATLAPHLATVVADSSAREDGRVAECDVPEAAAVDTLLVTPGGTPVAVRVAYETAAVTLVADDRLFTNRALRHTDAGPIVLGWLLSRDERVLFDEYHHGFGPGGSLAGAALDWTWRSPLGWAMWQLAAVGVLALLVAGVRLGPARSVIQRRRRSPLEHVRALATALAAARGHDVAVELIVRGLRRRLGAGADRRSWLAQLPSRVRTPRAREAAEELVLLTRHAQQPEGVVRAAHAVEDVWEELRP